MPQYSQREIRIAWAVHALTSIGVILGFVGLNAVIEGHARAAILWLIATVVLDGVDGPIARKLDVRSKIPVLDGHALDLVIDYFTCCIMPVAFLDKFDILPKHTDGPVGFVILFVSALWMARTDQETSQRWFRGFPGMWNMIIPTLYLLRINGWISFAICVVLSALTLSKVQFPHPISVRENRAISITCITAWLASMLWLAIAQHNVQPVRIVLIAAPMWTVFQVIRRLAAPKIE